MATEIDLRGLARDRTKQTTAEPKQRAPLISRYVVPGAILMGFVGMLVWAARDKFMSSIPVTVVPVIVSRAEVQQAGTLLFQAAGWIEPRPTPILVSALTEGIVAELLVVEGQEVEVGQPVARLIDTELKLALDQANAGLELQQAALANAEAELQSATLRVKHPAHLQALVAEAQSALAKAEGDLARLPFQIVAAKARSEFTERDLENKELAGEAIAGRALRQAQSDHDAAVAQLSELGERLPNLEREIEALRSRHKALSVQLELLVEEKSKLAIADGQVRTAEVHVRQAELAVQAARLRLERTVIQSPMRGRVLALVTRPGARVMGFDPLGESRSNTIVTLYDPQLLQVRADVRLEDVPMIQPGQPVLIETASAKSPIRGEVLRATSLANVQKNTLEVKVAILDPPPVVRPDMLVSVAFLAPDQSTDEPASEQQERLLVPRQLVQKNGQSQAVWIADANNAARLKQVQLGPAGTPDLVEVLQGIAATDRLISSNRESLKEGARIAITGEDTALGLSSATASR
jgi:multidrug resistance efflux pump